MSIRPGDTEESNGGDEGESSNARVPLRVRAAGWSAMALFGLGATCAVGVTSGALSRALRNNKEATAASWGPSVYAACALLTVIIITVTSVLQWSLGTEKGLKSAQKIMLTGGAVGVLILFTAWPSLTTEGQLAFAGMPLLMLYAGAGMLLEPAVAWRAEQEAAAELESNHRALRQAIKEALVENRSGAGAPAQGEVRGVGWWRRLSRRWSGS